MKAAFLASLLTIATAVSAVPQYTKPTKPGKLPPKGFVYPKGRELFMDGKTFYFGGTNTYYLYYAAKQDVDALFADGKSFLSSGSQIRSKFLMFPHLQPRNSMLRFSALGCSPKLPVTTTGISQSSLL